jgi:hypothetical protein
VGASQGTSGSTSITQTRTPGAVNNVIITSCIIALSTATPACSDSPGGHTWIPLIAAFQDTPNGTTMRAWMAYALNTSSTTITVSGGGGSFIAMTVDEFSGVALTSAIDAAFHSTAGASGTPTSSSFTPAFDNELAWAVCADTTTGVGNIDGSAATKGGDDGSGDWSEFRVLVGRSGISMTAAFAGSGAYDVIGATLKAALIGSPAVVASYLQFPKCLLRRA